jgi:hypothetical protein
MERASVACAVLIRAYTGPQPHPDFDQQLRRIKANIPPFHVALLDKPFIESLWGTPLGLFGWALIAGSLFSCRCRCVQVPRPAFTLEARNMVGGNDPDEGTTQLSPELWIDFGITTFLSPVFE